MVLSFIPTANETQMQGLAEAYTSDPSEVSRVDSSFSADVT